MNHVHSSSVVATARNIVNTWYSDACDYKRIRSRILRGELSSLTSEDRTLLIAFIVRNGILHKAVQKGDEDVVMTLVNEGCDLNALDENGIPVLAYAKTFPLIQYLLKKGAVFGPSYPHSFLGYVLDLITVDDLKDWSGLVSEIILTLSIDDIYQLNQNHLLKITFYLNHQTSLKDMMLTILKRTILERPEECVKLAQFLINYKLIRSYFEEGFYILIKEGIIDDAVIEQVITLPEIVYIYFFDEKPYNILLQLWTPTLNLQILSENLRYAAFLRSLLNTNNLTWAALLLSRLEKCTNLEYISSETKKQISQHLETLQIKEGITIWQKLAELSSFSLQMLFALKFLGINPLCKDPDNQNFLFTDKVFVLKNITNVKSLGFEIDIVNKRGHNALEHHCRFADKPQSASCIKTLCSLGLRLSDHFPNVELCRSVFPNNFTLQAFLGACLYDSRRTVCLELHRQLPLSITEEFDDALSKNPALHKVYSKIYGRNPNPTVSALWCGNIPTEAFELIPESGKASLVISAIIKQNKGTSKRLTPQDLMSGMSQRSMIYFHRYLFDNPDIMSMLVSDYMKVKEVYIMPGGATISTHAKIIEEMIVKLPKLKHVPKEKGELNDWQQKLSKAFNARIPPKPVETLPVPNNGKPRLQGRTVIYDGEECEGFKFLKQGEKYKYFAQELSVTEAMRNTHAVFKSTFMQSVGIYALKTLPADFEIFKEKLSNSQPYIVYHYKAPPGKFKYLQDLSVEEYTDARKICLHDTAILIKSGIYPDLAPIFHNESQNRKYVIFVDLLVRLMLRFKGYTSFNPGGGAGRLDQIDKIKYPNMTQTGLTDNRDARRLLNLSEGHYEIKDMNSFAEKNVTKGVCYYQMEALARALLVDMLILQHRYFSEKKLHWQDNDSLIKFSNDIVDGIAFLIAPYSEKPHDQSVSFIKGCGIDWLLAARQIAFWLDTSERGYPQWLAKGKVPEDIYDNKTVVIVDVNNALNFDPVHGCRTEGHQDIGLYNGPLALTEWEKALHIILINTIALAEPIPAENV